MEEVKFKFSVDWTKSAFYCGLDVHKHELAVAVYSADESLTEFVKTDIFSVDSEGLERFWNFVKKYQPCSFAMEATGIYHHVVFKFLKHKRKHIHWPFKISVVNPADANGLPGRQKYDKIDAIFLAKYLSKGLLKSGKVIVEVLEDLKAIFRLAARLERDRTMLKNRIKKTLDRAGIRPRRFNLNNEWVIQFLHQFIAHDGTLGSFLNEIIADDTRLIKHRMKIIKNIADFIPYTEFSLTPAQRSIIRQDLVELDFKTGRKALLATEIDQALLDYPTLRKNAQNLTSIPGLSPFSAVWILAEIGNITQFPRSRQFAAYCGCCPRVVSSAGKVYSAHTFRHSNSYLRTIFYNAAIVVSNFVKKESDLKNYAQRVITRKGTRSFKLAYCIIAGKICRIVYAILRDGVPFSLDILTRTQKPNYNEHKTSFSVTDRKILRRARNTLARVGDLTNIGMLGDRALSLAKGLDLVLKGRTEKKFYD